jgi:hypothetical protein
MPKSDHYAIGGVRADIIARAAGEVVYQLMCDTKVKRATKYLRSDVVVNGTYVGKVDKRERTAHIRVKIGRPNYAEKKFVKQLKDAEIAFPVRRVILKHFPVKRA